MIPAIVNNLGGLGQVLVIAEEEPRIIGRNQQMPDIPRWQGIIIVVQHLDPRTRQSLADRARPHRPVGALAKHKLQFRNTVMFPDRAADAADPFVIGSGLQRFARGIAAAQRREVEAFLHPVDCENPAIYCRHRIDQRDLELPDGFQHALGMRAALKDRAGDSVAQCKQHIVAERADKAPFAGRHHDIARLRRDAEPVHIPLRDNPAMRMDNALWPSRRPRRIDRKSGLIGPGVGGRNDLALPGFDQSLKRNVVAFCAPRNDHALWQPVAERAQRVRDVAKGERRLGLAMRHDIIDFFRAKQRVHQHR